MGRQGSTPLCLNLIDQRMVRFDFMRELVQAFPGLARVNHGPRVVPVLLG